MSQPALQMCPCGSGLRAARCCGMNLAAMPPPESTRHLVPLVERAVTAHRQGAIETAERLCLDVLELAPDRPGALGVLYQIRKDAGEPYRGGGADPACRRAGARTISPPPMSSPCCCWPRAPSAEAEIQARNAVRIAPQNPQSHNLMGMILTEAQRPPVGEYHYRKVLELSGARDPILLANLAWNLKNQGRMEEARALYRKSVAAAPNIRQTLLGWARLEEADRKFDAAAGNAGPDGKAVAQRPRTAAVARRIARADEAATTRRWRCSTPWRGRPATAAGSERTGGEGTAARPDGPLRRCVRGVRGRQTPGARTSAASVYLDARGGATDRSSRPVLHRRAVADLAARRGAKRRGAADLRAGLPPVGHHADGADAVGASAHRRRRRTAADHRPDGPDAAHARTVRWAIRRRWPNCGWATSGRDWTTCGIITCRRSVKWGS